MITKFKIFENNNEYQIGNYENYNKNNKPIYNIINEEYAYERIHKRKKEAFDKLGKNIKRHKYDAEYMLKKLKKDYPIIDAKIINYYDSNAKVVFIPDTCTFLHPFNRDSDRFKDGVDKDFCKYIKSKGREFSWHHPDEGYKWDGIIIIPIDYYEFMWYYNESLTPPKKINIREDKSSLYEAIKLFKNEGLNVYEPDMIVENDKEESDRDIVELQNYGMIFRFYLLKNNYRNREAKRHAKRYNDIIDRHLLLVKKVYDYCEKIAEGPLWTMCGGGTQLQQFYGDDNGYIGILYLDLEYEPQYNTSNFYFVKQSKNSNNLSKIKFNFDEIKNSKEIKDFYKLKKISNKYNI